jgi:hypothetical protein
MVGFHPLDFPKVREELSIYLRASFQTLVKIFEVCLVDQPHSFGMLRHAPQCRSGQLLWEVSLV